MKRLVDFILFIILSFYAANLRFFDENVKFYTKKLLIY